VLGVHGLFRSRSNVTRTGSQVQLRTCTTPNYARRTANSSHSSPSAPHVLVRYSSCIANSPDLLCPAMWDDEDNNPYGSFARHDSNSSDVPGLGSPGARKATAHHLSEGQHS
jgi:hypothetical protein